MMNLAEGTEWQQIFLVGGTVLAAMTIVAGVLWALNQIVFRWVFRRELRQDAMVSAEGRLLLLLKPDFAAFESHFGMPAPNDLRDLYADQKLMTSREFGLRMEDSKRQYFIQDFLPAEISTFRESEIALGPARFAFALDALGNLYYRELAPDDDLRVYLADIEAGETDVVSPTLAAFRASEVIRAEEME